VKLTVYSKPVCPYCDMAKNFLTKNNFEFDVVDISEDPAAREFIMSQGHRTVPQIYWGTECFVAGGWQGLSAMTPTQVQQRIDNLKLKADQ
jgi:glutaredoxin-like protein NrdH